MGIFGVSSKSKTKVFTTNIDRRIGATDEASVITLDKGAQINIDSTDPALLEQTGKALSDVLGFAGEQISQERGLVQRSLDLVETRTQSEATTNFQRALTMGAVVVLGVVLVRRFRG